MVPPSLPGSVLPQVALAVGGPAAVVPAAGLQRTAADGSVAGGSGALPAGEGALAGGLPAPAASAHGFRRMVEGHPPSYGNIRANASVPFPPLAPSSYSAGLSQPQPELFQWRLCPRL